ncbi:sensor histidine kinase [Actinoplanes sp. NPDC051494]|uniref:sensor histidine kinase n=1 Tax=Actinoplanes sp. NPDC051494 TaxID=3363907 RepID=UPI00379E2D4C
MKSRALDAIVLVVMLVTAGLGYDAAITSVPVLLTFTLLAWLPLVVRTRWPLPVLVVVVLVEAAHLIVLPAIDHLPDSGTNMGVYQPTPIATMIAVWTVASRRSRTAGWWAGSAAAVTLLVVGVTAQPLKLLALNMVVLNLVLIATAIGVGATARRERRERLAHERREDARQQVVAERLRIARDLHDVLAHHLTLVNAQAGVAGYLMRTDPAAASTALHDISEHTRKALDELRATVGLLRQADDPEGDPTHPAPGLDRLGDLVGPGISLHVQGSPRPLVPATDLAAYRIVQEALTNARKHAAGARVGVELRWLERDLRIRVENGPGQARQREHGGGHGLIGMRERARACGGELTTHRSENGGFVVLAILPLEKDTP